MERDREMCTCTCLGLCGWIELLSVPLSERVYCKYYMRPGHIVRQWNMHAWNGKGWKESWWPYVCTPTRGKNKRKCLGPGQHACMRRVGDSDRCRRTVRMEHCVLVGFRVVRPAGRSSKPNNAIIIYSIADAAISIVITCSIYAWSVLSLSI